MSDKPSSEQPSSEEQSSGKQTSIKPLYKRILLKISGEALAGDVGYGIDRAILTQIASEVQQVHELGVQIGIVVGGGNIFRGVKASVEGMDRVSADYMGMLATGINALAIQDALERHNVITRVMSGIEMNEICEPYIHRRAKRHLEKGRVVIFACGTGNPYFTTDTAAVLRANEIGADVILKATKVDGVFDKDPMQHSDAVQYKTISYIDILKGDLRVMDATAVSLCMEHDMPIRVFNITIPGNIRNIVLNAEDGTSIK